MPLTASSSSLYRCLFSWTIRLSVGVTTFSTLSVLSSHATTYSTSCMHQQWKMWCSSSTHMFIWFVSSVCSMKGGISVHLFTWVTVVYTFSITCLLNICTATSHDQHYVNWIDMKLRNTSSSFRTSLCHMVCNCCCSKWSDVCSFVCLLHSGILLQWRNLVSWFIQHPRRKIAMMQLKHTAALKILYRVKQY